MEDHEPTSLEIEAEPTLKLFKHRSLPADLRPIVLQFLALARWLAAELPPNSDRRRSLRSLADAQACALFSRTLDKTRTT